MSLTERKKEILRTVVEQYVDTAEPVGSKTVVQQLGTAVSAATVRNEMAELVELGLLEQPHTSAGRIPSPAGYRLYVNELMRSHKLSQNDTREISSSLNLLHTAGQEQSLIDEAGRLTSRLTTYPAYALSSMTGDITIARFDLIYVDSFTFIIVVLLSNDLVKNKLVHITSPLQQPQLVKLSTVFNASFTGLTEERITTALISATERALNDASGIVAVIAGFCIELLCEIKSAQARVSGELSLFDHPEYQDVSKAQRIIRYLSDDNTLTRLPSPESTGEIKITIGPENLADELRDSSVLAVRYDAGGDMQGLIGVVGPTRMDYSKVAAHLKYIAQGLGGLLSGGASDIKINELGDNDIEE